MAKALVEMAAEIIQSQCSNNSMTAEEISTSLQNTFKTLQELQSAEIQASQEGTTESGIIAPGGVSLSPEKSPARIGKWTRR